MIRILHVFGQLNLGGAESRTMDLYRNIDRTKVQFDFVVHNDSGVYEEEARSLGANIYRVPRYRMINDLEYRKAWNELFKKIMASDDTKVKFVHGHITSSASIYLPIAKKYGVESTIAHVRSAGADPGLKGMLTRFMRRNLADRADYLFACSNIAAVSDFGQKAVDEGRTIFFPNAIETEKFRFNPATRDEVRDELGLQNAVVIGHVGRFHYAKNHEYLLRIFAEMLNSGVLNSGVLDSAMRCSSAGVIEGSNVMQGAQRIVLILLGEGTRMDEMKAFAGELGISENVLFLGNHQDIYRYYNAMDLFIYPSRYEGLPGTVVEAQANGLKTIMSDTICDEVIVTELVETMSIEKDPSEWAKRALEILKEDAATTGQSGTFNIKNRTEHDYVREVSEAGFDSALEAKALENFYLTGKLELKTR